MENINLLSGINQFGYGQAGKNIALALTKLGINVSLFPIGQVEIEPENAEVINRLTAMASDYCPLSPSLRIWHRHDLAEHVGKGIHVGFPFFELNTFNYREKSHITKLDRLFVASNWAKSVVYDNFGDGVDTRVVPLGVDREIFHEGVEEVNLTPDHTIFINIGKWEQRKGHDFLIKAFNAAFGRSDKVVLRMACFNPFLGSRNDHWHRLYLESELGSKIELIPRLTTQELLARVLSTADCGVFPARAEGWNLDLLECMSMGKHVITTNVTAHTEYVNENNAKLIKAGKLESAEDGVWFHGEGEWYSLADDELEQTVEHLRAIHHLKQTGQLTTNQAGIETAKQFSWRNTASTIITNLE